MAQKSPYLKQRKQFASWLCYSGEELRGFKADGVDVASSKADFARRTGVTTRTLRRWEEEAETSGSEMWRLVQQAREAREVRGSDPLGGSDEGGVVRSESGMDLKAEFDEVRLSLLREVRAGDVQAMKTWFQLFGETFIEQERALQRSDLSYLSDVQLVAEFVELVGRDVVADVLSRLEAVGDA